MSQPTSFAYFSLSSGFLLKISLINDSYKKKNR